MFMIPFTECMAEFFFQGGNNITALGTGHLANALKENSTITSVSLDREFCDRGIDDVGRRQIGFRLLKV